MTRRSAHSSSAPAVTLMPAVSIAVTSSANSRRFSTSKPIAVIAGSAAGVTTSRGGIVVDAEVQRVRIAALDGHHPEEVAAEHLPRLDVVGVQPQISE